MSEPKTDTRIPTRRTLSPSDRERLAALALKIGAARAASIIGVHAQTLAALIAGLAAHRSTVALVERRLAEMSDAEEV